jgi:hypothetical protein
MTSIDPRVRAQLEKLGVAVVRSKLPWIMNVTALSDLEKTEPIGEGVNAPVSQIKAWVDEKERREACWLRVGVIAAIAAAVIALLSWRFPIAPPGVH